jgi:hypothetical protein
MCHTSIKKYKRGSLELESCPEYALDIEEFFYLTDVRVHFMLEISRYRT